MDWLRTTLGTDNANILWGAFRVILIVAAVSAAVAYAKKKSSSSEVLYLSGYRILAPTILHKLLSVIVFIYPILVIHSTFYSKNAKSNQNIFLYPFEVAFFILMIWFFWFTWFYRVKWNNDHIVVERWPLRSKTIKWSEIDTITAHTVSQKYKIKAGDGTVNLYLGQIGVDFFLEDLLLKRPDLSW